VSEDLERLQRSLERATAAKDAPQAGLDPQTASLREAWLAFGQLLEAAQPATELPLDRWMTTPPPARKRRWVLPAAAVLAASLLTGVVTTWMLRATNQPQGPGPAPEHTVSTSNHVAAPTPEQSIVAPTVNGSQWDDSLDEQLAQAGRQVAYAQQDQFPGADAFGLVQYRIEQISVEVQADKL
jgi:hypothetical protein